MTSEIINPELLSIIACPKCKESIELDRENRVLICRRCQLAYEIRNGIPIMLMDEAKPLEELYGQARGQ